MSTRVCFAFCLVLCLIPATDAIADTVFPISTSAQLVSMLSNTGSDSVPDGAVIELAAGTYTPPTDGFLIYNPDRDFAIRAETPGSVFLDGSGNRRIFRFIVENPSLGGSVVFEGLTFRNGYSSHAAFGSAITLQGTDATFIDCMFADNVNQSSGSGAGTVALEAASTGLFLRSTWQDNTSRTSGAGAVIVAGSTMWCHQCRFLGNRNNVPGHSTTATGAGFVAGGESLVYLSNTRFEANEAGFAGGAFDLKGSFSDAAPARAIVANSTFVDNLALPDSGVTTPSPTAGGVANIEDFAVAQFYNSRFIDNRAQFGGALASYRGTIEIHDSVLRGNFATGRSSSNSSPRGGAIFAVSDDTSFDGSNNRPTSQVLIRDSLFHGLVSSPEAGSQTAAAQVGGCIYATGDVARHIGQGVSQAGTQEENSARLDVAGTAFVDCDVEDMISTGFFGGGVYSALAIVTIDDSLFTDGDAGGATGAGGAIALTRYADATLTDTTFANNASAGRGGALFVLGASVDIDGCTFFENAVPGATVGDSRGADIFLGPQDGADLGVGGVVRNSLFAASGGLPIYDDDRDHDTGYYNTVTYENNRFFDGAFPPYVYRNVLMGGTGAGIVNVTGLNSMVVDRGSGNTTDKAPANNNDTLASRPITGKLLAVPPRVIDRAAAGDQASSTESFLAYSWHGDCAELDGSPLATSTGLTAADTGVHGLMVFDNAACGGAPDLDLTASVSQAATPSASLSADPVTIAGGGSSTLEWQTPSGTFLQSALDQGQGLLGTASGSVAVSPAMTTNYTYFVLTEEGGDSDQQRIYVDEQPPVELIFADGFESGNTAAWN